MSTTTTTTTTTAVAAKKEVTMNTTSGAATNPGPPLSQYSQVDLALGDYIAEGGFSFIFELLSIRNLSSESENHHDSKVGQDEFILQPAVTPGSSLDKQPPKYFPPNIPRTKSEGSNHKKNHKRGGGNGFCSFAGFVSRTASSSKGHKRGASSPAEVSSTVLPLAMKSATLTIVDEMDAAQQSHSYVVKCLKTNAFSRQEILEMALKDLSTEIKILQKLHHHPHIVELKAYGTMQLDEDSIAMASMDAQKEQAQQTTTEPIVPPPNYNFYNDRSSTNHFEDDAQHASFPYVILDRLGDTLDARLKYWQAKHTKRTTVVGKMLLHRSHAKHTFVLAERLQILAELASALEYMHNEARVIYRDLKPDNIAFDRYTGRLKLFDFGLSRDISKLTPNNNGLYRLTGLTGSARYMAPEVARADLYNEKCDVYGFAIVLWQVMALQVPYARYNVQKMFDQVYDCPHVRPSLEEWEELVLELEKKTNNHHNSPEQLEDHPDNLEWLIVLLGRMWSPLIDKRPSMRTVHSKLMRQLEKAKQLPPEERQSYPSEPSLQEEKEES